MLKVQKQMCLFLFLILVLVWSSCMYSVHMHILKHLFYMIRMQVSGRGAQRWRTSIPSDSEDAVMGVWTQHITPEDKSVCL